MHNLDVPFEVVRLREAFIAYFTPRAMILNISFEIVPINLLTWKIAQLCAREYAGASANGYQMISDKRCSRALLRHASVNGLEIWPLNDMWHYTEHTRMLFSTV